MFTFTNVEPEAEPLERQYAKAVQAMLEDPTNEDKRLEAERLGRLIIEKAEREGGL